MDAVQIRGGLRGKPVGGLLLCPSASAGSSCVDVSEWVNFTRTHGGYLLNLMHKLSRRFEPKDANSAVTRFNLRFRAGTRNVASPKSQQRWFHHLFLIVDWFPHVGAIMLIDERT